MIMMFKNIDIGGFFGCWGDVHLNYDHPKWVIAQKLASESAIEVNKDNTTSCRFLMNDNDEVTYYDDWDNIDW